MEAGVALVTLECNGYSWHFLSTCSTAGTVQGALLAFPHFTCKTVSEVDIVVVSIPGKEAEAQRGGLTCPRLHSQEETAGTSV